MRAVSWPVVAGTWVLAAMGTCGARPCWKATGSSGYKFKDKSGVQSSLTDMKLRSGGDGKAQLQVKGKGVDLASLAPPLNLDLIVQLIAGDSEIQECWQTICSNPKSNNPGVFSAKGP